MPVPRRSGGAGDGRHPRIEDSRPPREGPGGYLLFVNWEGRKKMPAGALPHAVLHSISNETLSNLTPVTPAA
jgi:hypothetical protein